MQWEENRIKNRIIKQEKRERKIVHKIIVRHWVSPGVISRRPKWSMTDVEIMLLVQGRQVAQSV